MPSQIRVLVLSAHGLFRECLTAALTAADSSFSVSSVEDPVKVVELSARPDVLILDLHRPHGISVAQMNQIIGQLPKTHVLVLGEPKSEAEIVEYLEAGAADYRFSSRESINELREAIHRVLQGHVSFSPERGRALFARLQELSKRNESLHGNETSSLSTRELQVLCLIEEGRSNKQIAKGLHLSLHTVKNHVHRILAKLDVHNRREAVYLAQTRGWLKMSAKLPKN